MTLKPLSMTFKARNSLQIISLLLLYFFFAFAGLLDCLLLRLKSRSARGTSHHTAFMGNCSTISHKCLALSTQWMSSPSRKWGRGVRFILVVLVFGVNHIRIRRQRESKIPNTNGGKLICRPSSSYRILLYRVAFIIMSNINDEAPLWKYVACLYMIGLMVVMVMVFFACGELVLVFWAVDPILRNRYGI